jgi:serine/threonine protein kinase
VACKWELAFGLSSACSSLTNSTIHGHTSLQALQHPNILGIVGMVPTSLPLIALTEHMQNGDLLMYLRACRPLAARRKEKLDIDGLLRIGSSVVSACQYLEDLKIVHRALMVRVIVLMRSQIGGARGCCQITRLSLA